MDSDTGSNQGLAVGRYARIALTVAIVAVLLVVGVLLLERGPSPVPHLVLNISTNQPTSLHHPVPLATTTARDHPHRHCKPDDTRGTGDDDDCRPPSGD